MDTRQKTIITVLLLLGICLAFVLGALVVYMLVDRPVANRPTPTPTQAADAVWERIQSAGKINVGISADYPPFASIGNNFKIQGYDLALVQEIGRRLDLPLDIQNMAFDGLTDALALGQIDMAAAAISVTAEREQLAAFSNVYFVSEDAVLAAAGSTAAIARWEDLAGYRVGVQRGSVYEDRVRSSLVEPGLLAPQDLVTFEAADQAVQALLPGSVDVVVLDFLVATTAAGNGQVKVLARNLDPQRYAIAMPQGAGVLQARINEALAQMQADGTLAALAKQYLQVDNPLPLPTARPTLAPPPTMAPVPTQIIPPQPCLDGMALVQDLNYPDNNMTNPPRFQPGALFQKGWRVRNIGTCTWNNAYRLVYAGGNPPNVPLGGNPVAVQGVVPPGSTTDLYVTLVAPVWPGRYQSFWTMQNAAGQQFGPRIWAGFEVVAPVGPTATPLPPAPVIYAFDTDSNQINQGECVTLSWQYRGQDIAMARLFRDNMVLLQDIPFAGAYTDCPPNIGSTTYQLVIDSNRSGSARASQVVEVRMPLLPTPVPQPVINYFYTDNDAITAGECVRLSWSYSGSDVSAASILQDGDTIYNNAEPNGATTACPRTPGNVTFTLQVYSDSYGTLQQSVYVSVMNPVYPTDEPPIDPPGPIDPPIDPPGPDDSLIQPRDG